MMNWKVNSLRYRGWLLWTLATGISWTIIIFPGFNLRNMEFSSWSLIWSATSNILLGCAVLGIAVGLTQYLALHFDARISIWWLVASVISYSVGITLGFLISAAFISLGTPKVLSNNGGDFMFMPLAYTMLIGGAITGLIQAYVLKRDFTANKPIKNMLLWTIGTALGWALGFAVASLSWGWHLAIYIQSAFAGIIIGAINGILFIVCIKKPA